MKKFYSIGLMSGSSLDGLDIVYSEIVSENDKYSYKILSSKCFEYESNMIDQLKSARSIDKDKLNAVDVELGRVIAEFVEEYIAEFSITKIDFIVNHGHTIYHFPEQGKTLQIGNNQFIANKTKIEVIGNLRQKDINLGGQGAPIVPIADLLLFSQYKYCLNLGGIMNISIKEKNSIISSDIGTCNQILNYYAEKLGYAYDKNGEMARGGNFNVQLFDSLNTHSFFQAPFPKSLDNGFKEEIVKIISNFSLSEIDILNTLVHHIAFQIAQFVSEKSTILSSGGGTHNSYLLEILKEKHKISVDTISNEIINYKEALAMCLMGVRQKEKKVNVLKSVTGAKKDSISGEIFKPC